jgi:hypothetical protein
VFPTVIEACQRARGRCRERPTRLDSGQFGRGVGGADAGTLELVSTRKMTWENVVCLHKACPGVECQWISATASNAIPARSALSGLACLRQRRESDTSQDPCRGSLDWPQKRQ